MAVPGGDGEAVRQQARGRGEWNVEPNFANGLACRGVQFMKDAIQPGHQLRSLGHDGRRQERSGTSAAGRHVE